MRILIRTLALALAASALASAPALAQSHHGGGSHGGGGWSGGGHGWNGGGHGWNGSGHGWNGGRAWGGRGWGGRGWGYGGLWTGVGLGLGFGLGSYYYGAPWYPGYVVTVPAPAPVYEMSTVPSEPVARLPDPIIYPRNGQSAADTEADRQACNRWATTQPSAMADASIFQRAASACMEGRGYTVR